MSYSTHMTKNVSSQSKKIKKAKASPSDSLGKYLTFGSTEKKAIISDVKKTLSKLKSLKQNATSLEFLEILNEIEREEFNQVLKNCLPRHVQVFEQSTENLRVWRRRVKDWMKVVDKPESRGCLLVPLEKLGEFKKHLVNELKDFSFRNLKLLKPKLYKIFQLIDKPIKDKHTCSKHWWYDFLKSNPEVKAIWEALPKRGGRYPIKIEAGDESDTFDEEFSVKDEDEEEDLYKEEEGFRLKDESIGDSTNACSPSDFSEQTESPINNYKVEPVQSFSNWPFERNFTGFFDEWNEEFQVEKRELEDCSEKTAFLKRYVLLEAYINPNAFEYLLP